MPKCQRCIIAGVVLLAFARLLPAQQAAPADLPQIITEPQAEGAQTTEAPPTVSDEDAPPSEERQWRDTAEILRRDIETADYYELLTMARQEGLATTGTAAQLRSRLYSHYSLSPPAADEADPQDQGVRIRVESAQETRFFEVAEVAQDMLILSGGVVLYLEEQSEGRRHRVQADRVVFNQSEEVITAQGNIIYSLERDNDVEEYRGETLTFRMQNWSGAFATGTTLRDRQIEDEQIEFSYTGEFITRSGSDVVVMEKGVITSSTADPPYYQIKADKIWIFAPGEWGLRHAVLYVGRVPLFYFPFYFNQGDEFFFSPGLASFPREGQAVYTTTYLYGQREEAESPVSVLQLAEAPDRSGRRRIEGLYYRDDDITEDDPEEDEGRMLKIMADLYSNLGGMLAVQGSYPSFGEVSNLNFFAGLGRTREIFPYAAGFSHWYEDIDEEELRSVWHTPYLLGSPFPFRYAFNASGQMSLNRLRLNAEWAYHSDPAFRRQQSRRNEDFQVLHIVTSPDPPEPSFSEPRFLRWQLSGSMRLPTAAPYISTLELQSYSLRLDWTARTIPDDQLEPEVLAADDSPMKRFLCLGNWLRPRSV